MLLVGLIRKEALECEPSFGDYLVAFPQTRKNLDGAIVRAAKLYAVNHEAVGPGGDEGHLLAVYFVDCGIGRDQNFPRAASVDWRHERTSRV